MSVAQPSAAGEASHPRLDALVEQARARAAAAPPRIGLVYPCDALALDAAARIAAEGLGRPVLIGPRDAIAKAADGCGVDVGRFELVPTGPTASEAAQQACALARGGVVHVLMKGSLHTDELMAAIVNKQSGLRSDSRISHAFLFDLPRYPKLLALADCVVNIAPSLQAKRSILGNAVALLRRVGIPNPKVGIVAAVESVNPAIPATLDAKALVEMAAQGAWPGAIVEGPFGFDNAISAEAARIKKIDSRVSGDADLLVMPDLNAGNMLYKSFIYIGGGECAGLVLGAKVPVVLTSRADSLRSRVASVGLAALASSHADGSLQKDGY
ncbi:MAG: Phosphate acetyltransferase [Burkholderiaceae bacterium]|jgi:phosphate acetyltransferase/phosphate butyryltransferase|nr:MAG: Phosphate acetyltransferase [Burkholderiaceae bacterium]